MPKSIYSTLLFYAICVCLSIGSADCIFAQSNYLLVTNPAEKKALLIAEKNYVTIRYQGYRSQESFSKGVITGIDSSCITILVKQELGRKSVEQTVGIADITGIKKLSFVADISVSMATVGSSIGSYVLLGSMGLHPAVSFIGSAAIGLSTHLAGIKLLRHYKMTYQTEDGWQMKYICI